MHQAVFTAILDFTGACGLLLGYTFLEEHPWLSLKSNLVAKLPYSLSMLLSAEVQTKDTGPVRRFRCPAAARVLVQWVLPSHSRLLSVLSSSYFHNNFIAKDSTEPWILCGSLRPRLSSLRVVVCTSFSEVLKYSLQTVHTSQCRFPVP